MGAKRRITNHYHATASRRGFEWIDIDLPKNTRAKASWRCSRGHEWQATYNDIDQGRGCPHCAHKIPKTAQQYNDLASGRGYKWIGATLPTGVMHNTQWRCPVGHVWTCTYQRFERGAGCLYCSSTAPLTLDDYHTLALSRGFMLAETPPTFTSLTKALWRCPHGHEWRATYGNIKKGQNCPYCSGHFKKSLADYHALANARGFAFVDELPSYAHNKALWRCPVGHEWLGTYVTISQGHGCPTCGYEAAAAKTRKEDTHKRIVARHLRNRRQKAVNTMTPELWEDALRYFNGCCAVCGRPPGLWHKLVGDHWIPLNDPLCPGTIPTNIVPLCHGAQGCNSSKRASDAKEWLTRKFGKRRAADILARIEAYFEHVKQPTP